MLLGCGQVVRHRFLVAAFAGSIPATPANYCWTAKRLKTSGFSASQNPVAPCRDSDSTTIILKFLKYKSANALMQLVR